MGNQPNKGDHQALLMQAELEANTSAQVKPFVPGGNPDEFEGYENEYQSGNSPNVMNKNTESKTQLGAVDNKTNFDPQAIIYITNMSIQEAESRFTKVELAQIKKEFDKNSKDQIIGKRKLIEFFRITELTDTYLSNELFNVIRNS